MIQRGAMVLGTSCAVILDGLKAAWRERYGGPSVVEVREIPKPVPAAGEVLVRVEAASVNRADLDTIVARWFVIRLFTGLRRPRVKRVGLDVAGVIEAVGEEATRCKVGDRVFGDLFSYGSGAFAEYVAAPEKAFAAIPDDMSFEVAACKKGSGGGVRSADGKGCK